MYKTITTNIMVNDVKETMKFYEDILKFETVTSVPSSQDNFDFAILAKDNITIMFQDKDSLIKEYPTLKTENIKPMFTLFITTEDTENLYNEIKDKVTVVKEPHQTFYGKLEFAFFDNNNNILTISN